MSRGESRSWDAVQYCLWGHPAICIPMPQSAAVESGRDCLRLLDISPTIFGCSCKLRICSSLQLKKNTCTSCQLLYALVHDERRNQKRNCGERDGRNGLPAEQGRMEGKQRGQTPQRGESQGDCGGRVG